MRDKLNTADFVNQRNLSLNSKKIPLNNKLTPVSARATTADTPSETFNIDTLDTSQKCSVDTILSDIESIGGFAELVPFLTAVHIESMPEKQVSKTPMLQGGLLFVGGIVLGMVAVKFISPKYENDE